MANPRGFIRPSECVSERFDYDGNGNMIYYGAAAPGTPSSTALWQIVQMSYDGNSQLISVLYANGSFNYGQIWDNRATLSYS